MLTRDSSSAKGAYDWLVSCVTGRKEEDRIQQRLGNAERETNQS